MSERRILELDGIRGIAGLSILFAHCLFGILEQTNTIVNVLQRFLLCGVDLFFVLSGFLIGGILLDNKGAPNYFRAFWTRRIARIFPVAYLLIATYAVALFVRARFDLPQLDLWLLQEPAPPLWTYATFTQSIPMALNATAGPYWMGITWSLAIEEQFYLMFPFVVYFLTRRHVAMAVTLALLATVVCRLVVIGTYAAKGFTAYVLLPCRLDGLAFGVLVALIIRHAPALALAKRYRRLLDLIAIALTIGIALNGFPFVWRFSVVSFLFAILILRIFLYEPGRYNALLRTPLLVGAGAISYALYMYHQAVNGLVHGFVFNQAPKIASAAELGAAIAVMVIATLLATLSYFYLERPIRRRAQRVKFRSQSVPAVA